MDQRRTPWKWILTTSNAKMRFLNSYGSKNRWKKNGVISLVFIFRSWVMVLKLSKIVSFLLFFADVSKKFKVAIAVYVNASESSRFALLKMVPVIMLWLKSLEDISVWSWWILLNFCWISTFLIFYSLVSCELYFRPLWSILFPERAWWGHSDGYEWILLIDLDFLLRSA